MKLEFHQQVDTPCTLIDFLHSRTELSKSSLKKALNFGGGWVKAAGKSKKQRCRRATRPLKANDYVSLYYDSDLYCDNLESPTPMMETQHWGIWYKPAGMVAQGSPYGDKNALDSLVQKSGKTQYAHLVHRLDREVAGLILVAYSRASAQALQEVWHSPNTEKWYQTQTKGEIQNREDCIKLPLDGKACTTHYYVVSSTPTQSDVLVRLESGRFHQIRRHLEYIRHPILGDPRYGRGNKNTQGLKLIAYRLKFTCPLTQTPIDFALPAHLRLFDLE